MLTQAVIDAILRQALDPVLRPYPNFHAARVRQPGDFDKDSFKAKQLPGTKGIIIIIAKLKGKAKATDPTVTQAYRFPKDNYTVAQAKAWLKKNKIKYILFEPAKPAKAEKKAASRAAEPAGEYAVERHLVFRADSAKDDDKSIGVVVASDQPIMGFDRRDNLVDQILLMPRQGLPESVPFVDSHPSADASAVRNTLGSIRDFEIEPGKGAELLIGRMYFAANTQGQEAYPLYRDKHLRDVSISAYATREPVHIQPGKSRVIRGRTFTAGNERPLDVFTNWAMKEVSAVIKGADVRAKVRRALMNQQKEGNEMNFEKWLKETKGLSEDEIKNLDEARRAELFELYMVAREETQTAEISRAVRAELEGAGDDSGDGEGDGAGESLTREEVDTMVQTAVGNTQKAERARIAVVREAFGGQFAELEREAIDNANQTWDEIKIRREAIKALREARPGVGNVAIHSHTREASAAILEAAIAQRAMISDENMVKSYGEQTLDAANIFRGMSLKELYVECARMEGKKISARYDNEQVLRAGISTYSLPGILGNVLRKSMLQAYEGVPLVSTKLCAIGEVSDFKQATRYRMNEGGTFKKVSSGGELKHGTLSEDGYAVQADTYGEILMLSRKDVINDDLGAFLKLPQLMGRNGALLLDHLFFTVLMTNANSFYHASNHNYLHGAAYAFAVAGMKAAVQTMDEQIDANSKPILVLGKKVLVPSLLAFEAQRLLGSNELLDKGDTDASFGTKNPYAQGYEPISTPYLANTRYLNYSSTGWYLFADRATGVASYEMVFLNGKQTPTIENGTPNFNTLGMGFRAYFDVGVDQQDPRGSVWADGTDS